MANAIRIYIARPYKGAYVFIDNEKVTHASPELAFTIGWPKARVLDRAKAVGFKASTVMNMTMPHRSWTSVNPKKGKK